MEAKTVKVVIGLVLVVLVLTLASGWMISESLDGVPLPKGNSKAGVGFVVINENALQGNIGFDYINPNYPGGVE